MFRRLGCKTRVNNNHSPGLNFYVTTNFLHDMTYNRQAYRTAVLDFWNSKKQRIYSPNFLEKQNVFEFFENFWFVVKNGIKVIEYIKVNQYWKFQLWYVKKWLTHTTFRSAVYGVWKMPISQTHVLTCSRRRITK